MFERRGDGGGVARSGSRMPDRESEAKAFIPHSPDDATINGGNLSLTQASIWRISVDTSPLTAKARRPSITAAFVVPVARAP
jgi:hypothetical protein